MATLDIIHAKIRLELKKKKPENSTPTALLMGNPTTTLAKTQ